MMRKNGKKYYLEEKAGGRTVSKQDIYELVVDSWLKKELGKQIIWHFTSTSGARKLVRLARAFGLEVWIGKQPP